MYNYIFAFIIGLVECFFIALNTKFLQRSKKVPCFVVSFVSVLLWFVVIGLAVENLHNWGLRLVYAAGFSSGDILAISLDSYLEKIAKLKGIKFKKRKHMRKKK